MTSSGKGAVVSAGPRIDLNTDLGEGFGSRPMGHDAALLSRLSSADSACADVEIRSFA
ncbi:MAG: LamB/YcsF family protein [Nesterenkonia sp.]